MQTYDLFMLAVLAGAALFGWWKGLAWQVASLGSILLSYFVALNFRGIIASKLGLDPPLDSAAAMLILYVGSSLAVWACFGFISKSLKEMKLKDWDHQIGALVGAAKGVLFCMLITVFAMTLGPNSWKETIPKSTSGRYIAAALTKTEALLPKDIHQAIAKYIDPVKSRLESGRGGSTLAEGEGDFIKDAEKAASDFLTNAKRKLGEEVSNQTKKGAEDLLNDLGKSVSEKFPTLGGSTPSSTSKSTPSATSGRAPENTSRNAPGEGVTTTSPLGAPRSENAGRPSVNMPDFSSKRWKKK
jgi:membrane protein required for colicin V production